MLIFFFLVWRCLIHFDLNHVYHWSYKNILRHQHRTFSTWNAISQPLAIVQRALPFWITDAGRSPQALPLLLKVWLEDLWHQHHLGAWWKQNSWILSPSESWVCIFTRSPIDLYVCPSLRNSALCLGTPCPWAQFIPGMNLSQSMYSLASTVRKMPKRRLSWTMGSRGVHC